MIENRIEKTIEVFYIPALNLPNDVLRSNERVGYYIHSDENGIIGYRIFAGSHTKLIPTGNVWKIELDL